MQCNNAIQRGQSQACLNYAERQQFRRSQYCNIKALSNVFDEVDMGEIPLSLNNPPLFPNNPPLFSNNPPLLRNNLPLPRDKRALPIPNKKEAYPMIYPLYTVLQITTPSDSPFDPVLGKS